MRKKKYIYKKKAQEGLNNLLSGETTDSILRSQESMLQKQDTKRGIEDSVNSLSSQFASPLGGKLGSLGNMGGEALTQSSFKKDGTVKKGQYAAGKAIKYGSTGAQIGSNPALMAATGGLSAPVGAALGATAGIVSGLSEAKNINYQAGEINKQKKTLEKQNKLQATVKERFQANQAKDGKKEIYIKPENRGKFTATKKATGKTTEELTHSKNPVTRKRAIFAQNAAKWNKKAHGAREIETEGREPIFSPKDKNGNRKLLYFNPEDPTHKEGGVKATVVPKNKYIMKSGKKDLVIPEGSAIVTAKEGKNKKALDAYSKGDKKKLESIINKMPEDKPTKKKNPDGNFSVYIDPEKQLEQSLDKKSKRTDSTQITPYSNEVDLQTTAYNIIDGKEVPQDQTASYLGKSNKKINIDKLSEGFNKAATTAPALYNLSKGLFGRVQKTERNFFNPELMKYQDASDPLRKAAQDEYMQTREEIRRGAPNASTYLANAQMAANQKYKRREAIENAELQRRTDTENQNVNLKNQARMTNLGLKNQYNDMDLQNKARKEDYLAKGLEQGSSLAQMSTLNKNRAKSDDALLNVIKSKNFKYNRDNNEIITYKKGSKKLKPIYKKKK